MAKMQRAPDALDTSNHRPKGTLYHFYTLFLFTKSDIKTVLLPQTIFSVSAFISRSGTAIFPNSTTAFTDECILHLLKRLPLMTLVLWSHLLLENFANQRLPGAVIEDKINKPWRPIPSGRITPQETQELLRRAVPLVLLLDSVLGIFTQGLIAMLLIWLYNDLDGSGATPFERNLINAVGLAWYGWSGIIVLDGSESKLASTERHILPYRWLAIMTMAVITTVHAQDFPDIEGDRMRGRRTMPLVYGQRVSRCSLAVLILIWSLACPIFCNPSSMLM